MSWTVLAAFAAACVVLAVTPGPNMSLIVANTLAHGARAGFITLAGAATGLSILVAIAAVGMTSVMVLMSEWFDVVRWAGAVYLIWLGARQLLAWWRSRGGLPPVRRVSGASWYAQGLAVSLSNPKVLLFLGAFLPQFVDPAAAPGPQLAVLSIVFVATLMLVDAGYTCAVARAREAFDPRRLGILDGIAGGLLVVGGLVLATARRP
jgi:threonine/homoserine/homoserine lactone efflux protein